MKKTFLFLIFISLFGCSGSQNNGKRTSQSLVAFQKYDFINSTFVPNSELIISIYNNGFNISKTGCESLFFSSQNPIGILPDNSTITITGLIDNYDSCYPTQLSLEISNSGNFINNKKIYSLKILSDSYQTYLDN